MLALPVLTFVGVVPTIHTFLEKFFVKSVDGKYPDSEAQTVQVFDSFYELFIMLYSW